MRSLLIRFVLCSHCLACWAMSASAQSTSASSLAESTVRLKSDQAAERAAVAKQLGERGAAAKDAIPELQKLLTDRDEAVRVRAAEAMWRIDGRLDAPLPVLFAARRAEAAEVRQLARQVTGEIGPIARAAIVLVVEQARLNRNQPTQPNDKAVQGLSKLGLESLPAIIEQFDIDLEAPRARADGQPDYNNYGNNQRFEQIMVPVLVRLGIPAVPSLKILLNDDNSAVRGLAAESLGGIGNSAKEVIPLLLPMLNDRDAQARAKVLAALFKLGPKEPAVQEAFGRVLREHKDQNLRTQTIVLLRMAGTLDQSSDLFRSARIALQDPDGNIRLSAAELLLNQSPPVAEAAETILLETKAREFGLRQRAVTLLAQLPSDFKPQAVDRVQVALRDPHFQVRYQAITAAKSLLSKEQLLVFARELATDDFRQVRMPAIDLIWENGDQLAALREWLAILESGDGNVVYQIPQKLQQITRPTPEMETLFARTLRSSNQQARQQMLQYFAQRPPQAQATIDEIAKLAESKSPQQQLAIQVLGKTRGGREKQLARFLAMMNNNPGQLDVATITALAEFGNGAKPAVPRLIELLNNDETPTAIRVPLISTLARIGNDSDAAAVAVVKRLSDPELQVRTFASYHLNRFGPRVVEPLRLWLRDNPEPDSEPDPQTGQASRHRQALSALTQLGPRAASAMPELMTLLPKLSGQDREMALALFRQIGGSARVQWLEMLKSSDVELRRLAAEILQAGFGTQPAAQELREPMTVALQDEDARVRTWAAAFLWKISQQPPQQSPDPKWVEILTNGLTSDDATLRPIVASALKQSTRQDPTLLGAARLRLDDADPAVYLPLAEYVLRFESSDAILPLLPRLVESLKSKDYRVSSPAAALLTNIGPKAAPILPDLIAILRGSNYQAINHAGNILGRIGEPALPALKELLADADDQMRQRLVAPIGQMQKLGLPLLIDLMKGPHGTPNVRAVGISYLLNAIDTSDEARQLILDGIKSPDRSLRLNTVLNLRSRSPLPASFGPPLIERLEALKTTRTAEGEAELAPLLFALSIVEKLDAKSVLPQIIDMTKPPASAQLQVAAAGAWAVIDTASSEPLAILAARLADPADPIATQVAQAIGQHAIRCRPVLPQLKKALTHQNVNVRTTAARVLAIHNYDSADVVAAMLQELEGENTGQHYNVIGIIALIPEAAKSAVPKLLELAAGNDRYAVFPALIPLAADVPAAEKFLIEQLKNNAEMQPYLVNALASSTRLPPNLLAALRELLDQESVRIPVAQLLAAFDPKSHDVTAPLVMQSVNSEALVLGGCLPEALRAISDKNTELQTQLREQLKSHANPQVRAAIARAVWHFDHDADSVLAALQEDLQFSRVPVWHHWTLRTLADMGPAAKPAFPKILKLATTLPFESQRSAAFALQQIDPDAAKAAGF